MKQKCSSLIGMILLASVLPACDLAKPMNKQPEPQNETPVTETAQKPEIKIAAESPKPAAIPEVRTGTLSVTRPPFMLRQNSESRRALRAHLSGQNQPLPPGWTPEKMAVAEQVKKELQRHRVICLDKSELDDIRPLCVGRNVVFSRNWLNFVGPNKPLSEKQFEQWRDRIDKVYESYEELTGGKPDNHDKIYIALEPTKDFEASTNGHAHRSTNLLCINRVANNFLRELRDIAMYNSSYRTVMHEIAHLFENGTAWGLAPEGFVHLFMSYAMETNRELQYFSGNSNNINLRRIAGKQHRWDEYRLAQRDVGKNIDTYYEIFKIYLLGLTDKIGWDTYKQIFRSYHDKNFKLTEYANFDREAKAREFLARIEHFSGKPDILKSLPDKGALLEKYVYYGPIPTAPKTAAIEK